MNFIEPWRIQTYSISDEDNDSDPCNQVQLKQDLIGIDGTRWQSLTTSHVQQGRLQKQNTSFSLGLIFPARQIIGSNPSPLQDKSMVTFLVFVEQCSETIENALWLKPIAFLAAQNGMWVLMSLSLIIGLVIARRILGQTHIPENCLWSILKVLPDWALWVFDAMHRHNWEIPVPERFRFGCDFFVSW